MQRRRSDGTTASDRQERFARLTVLVFVLASALAVAGIVTRRLPEQQGLTDVFSDVLNLPATHSLFGAVWLLLLTGALLRRKRFAMWIVVSLEGFGVLYAGATLVRAHSPRVGLPLRGLAIGSADQVSAYLGGIVGIAAVVALVWARRAFPARRSPGSYGAALAVLLGGLGITAAIAIALSEASEATVKHPFLPVMQGLRAAFGVYNVLPARADAPALPAWVVTLSGTLSTVVLIIAVAVFLRSGRGARPVDDQTELEVRTLLAAGVHDDSLGYFATRRDRAVIMSPDGRAAVSYRVVASVSLAAADPLGDPASWPAAISEWKSEARRYGWIPAVISAGRDAAKAYVDAGLRVIPLGDEAIIDATGFALTGPAMKPVRQAVVRAKRTGYTVSVRRHRDIEPAELTELAGLAERWRGDAPERGFSMALSRLGSSTDGSCLMVVANRSDGQPSALLSLVPWGRRGVSLDLMRRDRESVNGLIELMVTELIERRSEFGIRGISLNFAMFRAVFAAADELGAGPVTKLNNVVLGVFSRFFQLESLYRSNAKYQPTWVSRYLCIDSPLSLPRVALAAGIAEGFVPQPRLRRMASEAVRPAPWLVSAVQALDATAPAGARKARRPGQQQRIRRRRLSVLAAAGMPAYPAQVQRTVTLPQALGVPVGRAISVAGRVETLRDFGGVCFGVLVADGARLQVVLERRAVGTGQLQLWRRAVDRGDLVSVTGEVGCSRSGERSLLAAGWTMAAKSLRPLPPARTGMTDPEARIRDRSADLIVNSDAGAMIAVRSTAVGALRDAFRARGFREVETPILQSVHGGAAARPFNTHINAYHRDLSLRIAPELFLKRLIVGGTGPIFEIGRNFRNEGVDATHNPEFTSLEAYLPYADYQRMREITTAVIREVATAVHGSPVARRPDVDGRQVVVDLSAPWPVVSVHDAVGIACGCPVDPDTTVEVLAGLAAAAHLDPPESLTAGELVAYLYEQLVEPVTFAPTFYIDFPVETSPLTRAHRLDPRLSERWDLVAFGMEMGTAYSELTDPIDQRARLTEQSLRAAAGDENAMQIDEDFLAALELGMPPTGGLGLGVDRIVMMLTGAPIRSVLTFPFVRPLAR